MPPFFAQRRYQPIQNDASLVGRIFILGAFCCLAFTIVIARLFYLQVVQYEAYSTIAKEQHFGAITLPARRGEILIRDRHSGAVSKLATNTTLDLVYVDPLVAEDKVGIARQLAPLLFTQTEYEACKKTPAECPYKIIRDEPLLTPPPPSAPSSDPSSKPPPATEPPAEPPSDFYAYPEMVDGAGADILKKISKLETDYILLKSSADPELMAKIMNERLPGIFIDAEKFQIYGNPTLIAENRLREVAQKLAPLIDQPVAALEKGLSRKKVRYVFLKRRIDPEISNQITALDLKGVVLIPEHWRFYPENSLAANVIGFLNRENVGQYGVEGYFNSELEGKKGKIVAESDPFGRQITVGGESKIVGAVDGDAITLTIDRVVQKKVEEILADATEKFHADSGQAIIMDPFTGAIVAMANHPTFNPNQYGGVFEMRPLKTGEIVYKTTKVFKKNDKGEYVRAEKEEIENSEIKKYVYENRAGAEAYKNKIVSDVYEPGSAFKPITMAIGLDAKEVEPTTSYEDTGPLKIDNFEIKNALDQYYGRPTMLDVLAKSINTGTSFVAKKLGKELFYKYIKDFGLGEYTHIELEGETKGKVDYWKQWSKAQLLTVSFGQGIAVTPLQLITAWSALANGGKLIQPTIIESIYRGETLMSKNEPQVIRRVISENTSSIITSMLVNAVNQGVGRPAYIPDQLVAGKTGTSQIAGPNGKYEPFGDGAFITSFVGYFPALKPRFVILVKFDRPRIGENTWGSTTAAPTFKKIAEFLVEYYNLPPSR